MTEQSNAFSPPGATPAETHEAEPKRRFGGRKELAVVGGALAVAVVGAGTFLILFTGDGDSTAALPAVPKPRPAVTASPTPSASALPSTLPVNDGSTGRNPFKALIVPALATTGPSAPVPVLPTGVPTIGPTSIPTTLPTSPPTGLPTTPASPTSVKLVSVLVDNTQASVYVNGGKYDLRRTDKFAGEFQLLSMTKGSCANFLHGDAPFTICEGQTKIF